MLLQNFFTYYKCEVIMNIDYKKIVTTVHKECCNKDSPIEMQFTWGESKRVLFVNTMNELEAAIDKLGWHKFSFDRVKIMFDENSTLPYLILSYLQPVNWRRDETVAVVKMNKKSMIMHVRCRGMNLSNEDIKRHIKEAEEHNERFRRSRHATIEEWLRYNDLCGCFCDSYPWEELA